MPSTRTDVHSPANLVTEDYEYLWAFDTQQPGVLVNVDMDWFRSITNFAPEFEGRGTHQCHHCGARLRYVALLRHVPTGFAIAVGETCLENRFEQATADFQRMRKAAELDRAKQRIKKAAREFVDGLEGDTKLALDRDVEFVSLFDLDPEGYAARKIEDYRNKLWNKYGSLFESGTSFVGKLIAENKGQMARKAQIEAERAAEVKMDAPIGRVTFEGAVVKRTFFESYYGYTPQVGYKLIVKVTTDAGVWLCHVTEPKSFECERGDVVRLTATVTRSDRDSFFGFGKRPSNGSILRKATEAEMADSLAD